jgi:hypothetical protein
LLTRQKCFYFFVIQEQQKPCPSSIVIAHLKGQLQDEKIVAVRKGLCRPQNNAALKQCCTEGKIVPMHDGDREQVRYMLEGIFRTGQMISPPKANLDRFGFSQRNISERCRGSSKPGAPKGNRTPVSALRGPRPNR